MVFSNFSNNSNYIDILLYFIRIFFYKKHILEYIKSTNMTSKNYDIIYGTIINNKIKTCKSTIKYFRRIIKLDIDRNNG
jgi:hypothetical protein